MATPSSSLLVRRRLFFLEVCHEDKRSCRQLTSNVVRITYEIIERNKDLNKIILARIKTRGVFIAHRIKERLEQLENITVPDLWNWTQTFP